MPGQRLRYATAMLCGLLLAWLGWQVTAAVRHPATPWGMAARPLNYRVNINTADEGDLALLPGVGPATAQNILAYRAAHGPFTEAAQLEEVKRIGPVTRAKIEPWVEFGPPARE